MSGAELQLLMDMGFSRELAEKALSTVGNQGLDAAAEWLLSHSDDSGGGHVLGSANDGGRTDSGEGGAAAATSDPSLDKRLMAAPPPQARSLKCEDCGKQFRSERDAERHAAKTNHQNFSESVEEVKPLTEEEKKAQLARLEERLQQNRAVRLEQERVEAKEREQLRRKSNREIAQAREELELREAKKLAEQKKREREEDRLAKQRVKEQIARDRAEKAAREKAERAAREAAASGGGTMTTLSSPCQPVVNPVASSQPKKEYDTSKLQIRLFGGQILTHSFDASDTLVDVNRFIITNRGDDDDTPFSLMTNFPKHIFTTNEMSKSLKELGLVPTAVLILTRLS